MLRLFFEKKGGRRLFFRKKFGGGHFFSKKKEENFFLIKNRGATTFFTTKFENPRFHFSIFTRVCLLAYYKYIESVLGRNKKGGEEFFSKKIRGRRLFSTEGGEDFFPCTR